MSKVFFISDLHFGHKYVIAFDKRPFKNVQEMEREMIRRWNAKVSPEDHVFVVGDMFGKVTTAHAGEIAMTPRENCLRAFSRWSSRARPSRSVSEEKSRE